MNISTNMLENIVLTFTHLLQIFCQSYLLQLTCITQAKQAKKQYLHIPAYKQKLHKITGNKNEMKMKNCRENKKKATKYARARKPSLKKTHKNIEMIYKGVKWTIWRISKNKLR